MVKRITENEFAEVKEQELALIDFSAIWCGPCKMLAPVLEGVSEQLEGQLAFYNVDVDECPELADRFEISNIPAMLLLKKGEKVDMKVGFAPKDGVLSFIKANM